jgi:hypothetical protein
MAILRSPGVVVRELDLTNGRADIANNNIAGFAAPFTKGEIGEPQTVTSEADLIRFYGEPSANNAEYWLSATNYLAYGGTLSVVRTDSTNLKNAVARVGSSVSAVTVSNPALNGKYVSAPAVTFSGGGGSGAAAVANINSEGRVTEIVVTDTGSGYSSAPNVTVAAVGTQAAGTAAQGTTATAEADGTNISAGALTGSLTITNGGSGYSGTPNITISGGGGDPTGVTSNITVVNGQITDITLSGGSGYTSAPTIVIEDPTGVVVTITSPGSNYDSTQTYNVNVTGGASNTPFTGTLQVNQAGSVTGVAVASNANFGDFTNFAGLSVVIPEPGVTATATATITADPVKINNGDVYEAQHTGNTNGWLFAGRTAGAWANGLRVAIVDNGPRQSLTLSTTSPSNAENITVGEFVTIGSKKGKVIDVTSVTEAGTTTTTVHLVHVDNATNAYVADPAANALFVQGDVVTIGATAGNTVSSVDDGSEWYRTAPLYAGCPVTWNSITARPLTTDDALEFGSASVRDAVHVVIVDETGAFTGQKHNVLETFTYRSKAWNARGSQGGTNYFKNIVSSSSEYVYAGDTAYEYQGRDANFEPKGALSWGLTAGADYPTLSSGEWNIVITDLTNAYDYFRDEETVNVEYLVMGPGLPTESDTRAKLNHIASIAADRKDCIAFGSPHKGNIISDSGLPLTNAAIVRNLKDFFAPVGSNSYLVLDCNYKYVYDRWNDVYRYIPCNTDVAGLVADTAIRNEPWFSPAGFSRGGIRNAAKLAWNPSKADRDELYANRINPIAIFPGQGAVLFGDKTALSNPSAFDRINVRRLFLVIEAAIEEAAKAQLFEINDETTREVFKSIVVPFLRDVQARRGVTDFLVVCDETNNTSVVVDNNEFVADIYVQPARSINFITLTFTATRTGISFSEAVAN